VGGGGPRPEPVDDELRADLEHFAPIELFIDTVDAVGAVVAVQEQWAEFIGRHRSSIKSVSMLVQGKHG
jgi:hypothetical protein